MDLTRYIDDLLSRLSLKDLVGKDVKLQKRGREYIGLCPFHDEKTPSFHVVEHKQFYHCFGCGKHGRAIEWVMEQNRYDFKEAIQYLAPLAGLEPPIFNQQNILTDDQKETKKKQEQLYYAIMQEAARFYAAALYSHDGQAIRDYCASRQLDNAIMQEFQLGYAPETGLYRHLMAAFPNQQAICESLGLIRQSTRGQGYYDFFRHRLIFPIHDKIGRIIGFGGRYMGDAKHDNVGKYVNSPETPLFDKSRIMFNAHRAFSKNTNDKPLIIVEGYMDAISVYNAGFHHVVAPLGTAINDHHFTTLWRYNNRPIMAFDGDNAGQKAALRNASRALNLLSSNQSLGFAFLPANEDPDSYIQHYGAAAFSSILAKAQDLHLFLWEWEAKNLIQGNPQSLAQGEKALLEHSNAIGDSILRQHYKQFFKNKLWEWQRANRPPSGYNVKNSSYSHHKHGPLHDLSTASLPSPTLLQQERHQAIIAILLLYPELLNIFLDEIMAIKFSKKLDKMLAKIHKLAVGGDNGHIRVDEHEIFNAELRHFYPDINRNALQHDMTLQLQSILELERPIIKHHATVNFKNAEEQQQYYRMHDEKARLHTKKMTKIMEK